MSAYSLIRGDIIPEMDVTMSNQLDLLAGAQAVELEYTLPDGSMRTVPLTVVDAPSGALKRTWIAGDTDQIGLYYGRVKLTVSTGVIGHWPDDDSRIYWAIRVA
jgi:hypothetical protein